MSPRTSDLPAVTRFYEVTIVAHGIAATVVSFPWGPPKPSSRFPAEMSPSGSFEPAAALERTLMQEFGVRPVGIAYGLEGQTPEILALSTLTSEAQPSDDVYRFVHDVFYEPLIPVEQSPVSGRALGDIFAAGPERVGAVVGALVAAETEPWLLFVSMPGGMIVFGAAAGVAEALRLGLRTKMLGWLGVEDPQAPAASPPGTPQPGDEDAPPDDDRIRG